jgi:hypothetical protein
MAHDMENEMGYKKPPKAFRFQKGQSGNPSGRPRKARGIPEMLGRVAEQKVLTNGKNGPQWMTKIEASLTQLINQAASGNLKAIYLLAKMMTSFPETVKATDVKDKVTSAKAKLLKLLETRYGSFAEGAAEPDQPSDQQSERDAQMR